MKVSPAKSPVKTAASQWRFYSVVLLLLLLMAALLWHVINIQILPGEHRGFEFLQSQGLARTLRTEGIPAHRGIITDRHGEPLAVSTPVISIWANPEKLLAARQQWPQLSKALSIDGDNLQHKLSNYKDKQFVYLRRQLAPAEAQAVLDLAIDGVYGKREYRRFYPAGEVAAHVVGFTNIDDVGQEGIELSYDQWLAGTPGKKQVLKDRRGRVIKEVGLLQSARTGKDIALSIDLRLQYLAYKELKAAVQAHNAKSGSLVLLDAQTGEVLAMVNQPSYNPNNRSRLSPENFRNRAITDQFEPGSTMKPLTIMAALESGRYSPTTVIDTHPGYMRVGSKTLLDPVNYGAIDVTKIITKSSQVGLTKISLDLEGDSIRDMFFRLGIGQSVGTGFPGEGSGLLPSYDRWQPIVQANFSFGYGVTVTALQLAQAYSVIANQGVKQSLSILKQQQAVTAKQVVAQETAQQATAMLKTVMQPGGTAANARLKSYQVAGKTGTIHNVGANGYIDDSYLSLFVGFAPADKPRIIAVVTVNEPSNGKYFGGEVAAPVFARVVDNALRLLQVPPTNAEKQLTKTIDSVIYSKEPAT